LWELREEIIPVCPQRVGQRWFTVDRGRLVTVEVVEAVEPRQLSGCGRSYTIAQSPRVACRGFVGVPADLVKHDA
jgi:hypothetical protein